MHENFQFAAIIVAIFAGILFNRTDSHRLEDRLNKRFDGTDKRFDGIDQRFDGIDQRLDLIQRDQREFYATQRVHDEAIDTLKKKGFGA